MQNRADLWNYLVRVAERKAIDLARAEGRQKRGGGRVQSEQSAFGAPSGESQGPGLESLPALGEPSPELAAQLAECCYDLLGELDEEERLVVIMKGEGCSNKEIAAKLGRVERSVERKLNAIRAKLKRFEGGAD
jgi:RNA polymerase sigma factor (sigma-70 family)